MNCSPAIRLFPTRQRSHNLPDGKVSAVGSARHTRECCDRCWHPGVNRTLRLKPPQPGRSGPIAASLFFCPRSVSAGRSSKIDRAAFSANTLAADGFTLDPTWLGWLQRVADEAAHGTDRGNFLARDANVHGEHAAARHGFRKHGAVAGSARAAPGYAAGGICAALAGCRAAQARRAESTASRSAARFTAAGNSSQRKRTFTLPWEEWLRGPLRSRLEASFASPAPPARIYISTGFERCGAIFWREKLPGLGPGRFMF